MGSKTSGNRTHAPRAPGAGRPKGSFKPPRIDSHGYLIFNVSNLTREEKTNLMLSLRPFWKPSPAERIGRKGEKMEIYVDGQPAEIHGRLAKAKRTSQLNKMCESPHCPNKATRKVVVSGTGGWEEDHYYCKQHADEMEDK